MATPVDPSAQRHYAAPRPVLDSENIDRIAKAQAVISSLLGAILLLLIVGLVLSIVGYNKITERLDNIEHSSAETSEYLDTTPPAPVAP